MTTVEHLLTKAIEICWVSAVVFIVTWITARLIMSFVTRFKIERYLRIKRNVSARPFRTSEELSAVLGLRLEEVERACRRSQRIRPVIQKGSKSEMIGYLYSTGKSRHRTLIIRRRKREARA